MSIFGNPVNVGQAIQQATALGGTSRLPVTPAYIVFGDPILDAPSALGTVTFDAILSEQHDRNAIVTDHPVEEGINVVDHMRPLPDRLTLEVFVSNSPVNSPDAVAAPLTIDLPQPSQGGFLAGGTSALLQQGLVALGIMSGFPQAVTVQVDQFEGDTDYVADTWKTLTELRDSATVLQVITPRASYQSMVLENISLHRDPSTGTSGNFTLEFRQIRTVTSSVTAAPQPAIKRAQQNVSMGQKDPTPASAAKQSVAAHGALKAGLNIPPPALGFPAP